MANLQEYLQQTEKEEVKLWINHNLANYLKKEQENISDIEHIIDFLNSDKAPTRLKKMSYTQAKEGSEKWQKTLVKQARNIIESDDDVEVIIDFDNGTKFVQLTGKSAFLREGKLMGHCVASYYGKEGVKVYSLRDSKNNPHCTLEVVGENNVQQIKGKGNGSIHPNYIKYIIRILQKFDIPVRGSELKNLGYDDLPEDYVSFLETNFTGIKYITFDNKKYVYNKSKIVKKAA